MCVCTYIYIYIYIYDDDDDDDDDERAAQLFTTLRNSNADVTM